MEIEMNEWMPDISGYSDYTIAMKLQAGQAWHIKAGYARVSLSLPEHPLLQCEALATKLNG